MVAMLLDLGVDVEAEHFDSKRRALYLASWQVHAKIVELLLKHGVEVDARATLGQTALHAACEKDHTGVVSLLLEYKADPNALGNNERTALHDALHYTSKLNLVKLLLDNGADTTMRDKDDQTVLDYAKSCLSLNYDGAQEVISLLEKQSSRMRML